jgi:hypothetical protein
MSRVTSIAPVDFASVVCQSCGKSWQQVRGIFQAKRRVSDPDTSAIVAVWICLKGISSDVTVMRTPR